MSIKLWWVVAFGVVNMIAVFFAFRGLKDLRITAYSRGREDEKVDRYVGSPSVDFDTRIKMLDGLKVAYYIADTAEVKIKVPLSIVMMFAAMQIVLPICLSVGRSGSHQS